MAETQVVPVPIAAGPMSVNAFLLVGERIVVVDTGVEGQQDRLLDAVRAQGREPADVSLILLTHGHHDHAGSAAGLKAETGAPIALGRGDEEKCRRGVDLDMRARGFAAGAMLKMIRRRQEGREAAGDTAGPTPDVTISQERSLAEYGVDAIVVPTPGHSTGSLSVLTSAGDAIVGDLLGGGGLSRRTPERGIFFCDEAAMDESIRLVIARAPHRIFTGHDAEPFTLEQLKAAFPGLT